ncbi:centromere protein Q isoform X1 [Zalophus californianus]|uniref:Centromere protein Q n=1 Tax=Zalophus californianus TaxID=9704 RepID=A0A6J2DPK7_ZALCA|nr:centromere protein Q isoform X1 [Zalophus californianus]XP_027458333.1 centromere protein Q isoform X1 [Zalophus californianus]XP_027458334.1 centromere protein Q isoform X1 [Zalophus californianus]XP_027458335.1 centromere protein Q isoform X1 [Zalophus californianus]XP_027458337.1 centromere protein Q isoform X1 [Zalophus californianus]XP_027458338.1 centromere protein Q isoform X1 [Zalophus californianus]XP_027458339.1 centromere protein Q isoform X1 [Zalophus californianus]XP_02745834
MSSKASSSKKRSQQLKRKPKRKKDDEEMELPEKKVRNIAKNKNPKHLPSEVTGQTEHTNLKQVKIASNKKKTWQPLSESSREHLQSMMDSVIIAVLSNNIRENEQVQYHLNYLKKRLLQLCETLQVPPKNLKDLTNVSSLLKMERAQHRANEEGLALLQEEIDKIVETIESMTGNIQSLKNKIQVLTSEVEEEEEKVKQMFHIDSSGVLCLPELSQKSLKAPTLQKEILTLIPNHNALLKDLDVLHNSSQMKNMLTFIEEAYKRLDAS